MKSPVKISPEDYILSVLSPEDRLEAALETAKKAFQKTGLMVKDIEKAVEKVRRKAYEVPERAVRKAFRECEI